MQSCKKLPVTFAGLSDREMRLITGGGIWDKILTALMGVGLGAFYDMGKEEGRVARKKMTHI